MTNFKCRMKDEARMANECFDFRHSELFRHLTFDIRHFQPRNLTSTLRVI